MTSREYLKLLFEPELIGSAVAVVTEGRLFVTSVGAVQFAVAQLRRKDAVSSCVDVGALVEARIANAVHCSNASTHSWKEERI